MNQFRTHFQRSGYGVNAVLTLRALVDFLTDLHELERDLHKCNFQRQLLMDSAIVDSKNKDDARYGNQIVSNMMNPNVQTVLGTDIEMDQVQGNDSLERLTLATNRKVGCLRRLLLELTDSSVSRAGG